MSLDSSYKLYDGESPSMASNYINYFLESEYSCSLPRNISSDTLIYLRRYLVTHYHISGGNLVQELWATVEVNKLLESNEGYYFTSQLNPNYTMYVSYSVSGLVKEVYCSPDNLSTCNITILLDKYKRYVKTKCFGLDEAGNEYSGGLLKINNNTTIYSPVSRTFEYKKLDKDVEGSEDTYLLEVDNSGHGYVDRRILQYLLGYAITENSSCSEITDLQLLLYELASPESDPYNIYVYTSKFTKGVYDIYMKQAIQQIQRITNIPTSGYYDKDTEKELSSLIVDRKSKLGRSRSL